MSSIRNVDTSRRLMITSHTVPSVSFEISTYLSWFSYCWVSSVVRGVRHLPLWMRTRSTPLRRSRQEALSACR